MSTVRWTLAVRLPWLPAASQALQQCEIAGNERFLLGACPALQLPLAGSGGRSIGDDLRIRDDHRPARAGERTGRSVVVPLHPPVEIVCFTYVQSTIGAAQDVDVVHVRDDDGTSVLAALRLAPFDSVASLPRSGTRPPP